MIKTNHSKAGNFENLPAGTYEVIISGGAFKRASTGSDMINWAFTVRDDVEGQEQYKGRKLWSNLVFNENTEGIVQGFLKAIDTPDGKEFASYDELIKYATGRAVSLKVNIETYQGDERNNVKSINAPKVEGGKVDNPLDTIASGDPLDNGGNYTKVENDPFANSSGPIEVSDDELPF